MRISELVCTWNRRISETHIWGHARFSKDKDAGGDSAATQFHDSYLALSL